MITTITGHDRSVAEVQFYPEGYLFGGIGGEAFACAGIMEGDLRLFFLPNAETFNIDQLFFLLAVIRLEQDSGKLSADQRMARKKELKDHEIFNSFGQQAPWLKVFIGQLIDGIGIAEGS